MFALLTAFRLYAVDQLVFEDPRLLTADIEFILQLFVLLPQYFDLGVQLLNL